MGAEAWGWDSEPDEEHDRAHRVGVARHADERGHRRPGRALLGEGQEIYYTRYGQLELACANCHEDNNGSTSAPTT
jgi:L-cysteine S-thiosulfotransferase